MAEFSAEERRRLAAEGKALPDGSFPIRNCSDLRNAVHDYGRARPSKRGAVRRHIFKRAHELGCTEDLPKDWRAHV